MGEKIIKVESRVTGLKNIVYSLLIFGLIFGLSVSVSVSAYTPMGGGVCTCDSYSDCMSALNDNVNCSNEVRLTAGITPGIDDPENFTNKIFDCQGHTIEGGSTGIYLIGKSGNTIKNCIITGNSVGISLYTSPNNILTNNTVNGTMDSDGIRVYSSPNNILTNNTVVYADNHGIILWNSSNNILTGNTANGNFGDGIGLRSSSNNTLTKNTVNYNLGGIILRSSSNYNTLTSNTANNGDGIWLHNSSYNTLTKNTANNGYEGIYLYSSSYNTLTNNTANDNDAGIYLSSSNNIIINNTANSNIFGIFLVGSSNNNLTNNTANSNYQYGILLYSSDNNRILDNEIKNNAEYGVYFYSNSNNNNLTLNTLCFNKFGITDDDSNFGDENTCHYAPDWDDNNTAGCTYSCPETTCYCSDCSDCEAKLNSECTTVKLTQNITNQPGTCINNPTFFNHKIFDCQGFTIDGDDSGSYDNGIYLNKKIRNTIKNCVITDFFRGIYLDSSSNNNLVNNTASSNNGAGIYSKNSNSIINSNIVCGNTNLDLNSSDWLSSSGGNNTCDNAYGWSDTGYVGCKWLCNGSENEKSDCRCSSCEECTAELNSDICSVVNLTADIIDHSGTCINNPSKFNNRIFDCQGHTIGGDDSGSGIYLYNKENNTIKNCVITVFSYGIYLYYSLNNNIINNTANSNVNYGIYLYGSSDNNLINNTANNNGDYGISSYYSSDNTLTSNTANNNIWYGIHLYYSSSNTMVNNTANSNRYKGINLFSSSSNNHIINNTATNNEDGIYLWGSDYNDLSSNKIRNNSNNGVHFHSNSNNNNLTGNFICGNGLDVDDDDSNSGTNNTCYTTNNWNDTEATGCTYSCSKPDLSIINLNHTPKIPNPGNNVNITVTVRNAGDVPVTNINVSLFIDNVYENSKIINYLINNNEINVTFNWTAAIGKHNITIKVDPDNEINEINETNNQLSVIIWVCMKCDIGCDGEINFLDFVRFARSYGATSCDDPRYNPLADVNSDCKIDLSDFVECVRFIF